jgi:hypothetical protein
MTILLRVVFCVALSSASLAATPALAQSASTTAPLRVRLMQGVATPTVDTNGYAMKPAVRDELVQAFIKQVSGAGLAVSSDGVPTRIVLNAYKERSTEDRLILGGMGGRDHISVPRPATRWFASRVSTKRSNAHRSPASTQWIFTEVVSAFESRDEAPAII